MSRFAALLCLALLAGCNVEADFSGDLKTETLSAEEYQSEIVAIDRLVFQRSPLQDEGAASLQGRLESLATRVSTAKPDSKFLKLESLEIRRLALHTKDLPANALQNDWMRIRSNLFDDRAWFARSAKDLDEAPAVTQTTAAAPSPVVATPRAFEPRWALRGRWRVVEMTANGQPTTDVEMANAIWDFTPPHVIVHAGNGTTTDYEFTDDGSHLEFKSSTENGFVKYKITSEGLRLAFFDGLKGKPVTFEAAGGDPPLVIVRLVPIE